MKNTYGIVLGLKTSLGIALMQDVTNNDTSRLRLYRICDGFLQVGYTDEDVAAVINRKERFTLFFPQITKRQKHFSEWFEFRIQYTVPDDFVYPKYFRTWMPRKGENGKTECLWYLVVLTNGGGKLIRVDNCSMEFRKISPNVLWTLWSLQQFLEAGKEISDYFF